MAQESAIEWKNGKTLTGPEVRIVRESHTEKVQAEMRCGLRKETKMYGNIGTAFIYKYEWAFAPTPCGRERRLVAFRKLPSSR